MSIHIYRHNTRRKGAFTFSKSRHYNYKSTNSQVSKYIRDGEMVSVFGKPISKFGGLIENQIGYIKKSECNNEKNCFYSNIITARFKP
jgi:hypothetical protein